MVRYVVAWLMVPLYRQPDLTPFLFLQEANEERRATMGLCGIGSFTGLQNMDH